MTTLTETGTPRSITWPARALGGGAAVLSSTLLWLAVAALMLSFVPILGVEATAGTKAVLCAMHPAVAAILIPAMISRDGMGGER